MASILRVNTLTDASSNNSTAVSVIFSGTAQFWVKGTDAAVLSDSFNCASGTDNGTGDYTYAITNDMNNANYCPQCTNVTTGNYILIAHAVATGTIQVRSRSDSTSDHDDPNAITIHGDLA
tara:strand:+ start:359 stop:721 length:363 start_codon:yes stop_codon:yes gene_type:complete